MELAYLELVREGAEALGLRLHSDQVALLGRHLDLLLKWNRTINLTAVREPAEAIEKHVLDSLALAPFLPAGTLLDAGTGGGFPGIPVRIARPDIEVILVDSVQKKVAFLKSVLAELRLNGARALAVRLGGHPAEEGLPRVQSAVARALAAPAEWLELAQPYVLPGGIVLCLLGSGDDTPERHGDLLRERQFTYQLPFSRAERRIVVYRRG